jgi:multiple sugar transport system substrate-binding protein
MIQNTIQRRSTRLRTMAAALGLATSAYGLVSAAQAQEISFWTQPQGDILIFSDLMDDLTGRFRDQTGIQVNVETINASNQFTTWLTVAQGGAAPDCADMYWLHSFSGIGAGRYGPMPITQYLDQWPTLREDFYESTLQDVFWKNEFYGIPWRVDVRSFLYRTDFFEEAGLAQTPTNWDELVEAGKALTVRDANGNVTRWGYAPGNNSPAQVLYPFYWQAGGEFLSEDGRTATIDNEEMRTALKFMQDLVHVHQITSPEIFEKSSDPLTDFTSGNVAMNGSVLASWPAQFDRDYPELDGLWALGKQPAGPEGQAAFMGGGYWGVLYGTENVDACVEWIKFLSTPENMEQISRETGVVSPMRAVMASELWSDEPWKAVLADTVSYGHTSQQPTSVWAAIAAPEPGAVLYDLVYSTVIGNADIDAAVTQAQTRLQAELDRANSGS